MFEKMKANKKAKADEKKAKQIAVTADTLESANARRVDARHVNEEKTQKLEAAKWHERYLDKESMRDNVTKMRTNLFIQKDKLCKRIINANKEQKYIKGQQSSLTNATKYDKEIKRCQKESKESYYALEVVMDWINKVDSIENEYEWQTIMKDLTTSYKVIYEISDDTGLLAKLAFLINNFKLTSKGKINFNDIEDKYQKDINKLLDDLKTDKELSNFDVNEYIGDNVFELMNEEAVYNSIDWGMGAVSDENRSNSDDENINVAISKSHSDNKPSSAGETEKVTDNSDSHSNMEEPPSEMEEPSIKSEETSDNYEENSEREVISDNYDVVPEESF